MDFVSIFKSELACDVASAGENHCKWSCPFHPDDSHGRGEVAWSCYGWPDLSFHCFACKRSGSIVDLRVLRLEHDCISPGDSLSSRPDLRRAYREAFDHYGDRLGKNGLLQAKADRQSTRRPFDLQESLFLTDVYAIMHDELHYDREARGYLESRGVHWIPPFFGVARRDMFATFKRLAKEKYGDAELTVKTGLESHKPEYQKRLSIGNTLVAFRHRNERVIYWQAKPLPQYPRQIKYINPSRIEKQPLVYRPKGANLPGAGGEGIYKVAWLSEEGRPIFAGLGSEPENWVERDLRVLDGGIWFADVNAVDPKQPGEPPVGRKIAEMVRMKMEYSGMHVRVLFPPNPYGQIVNGDIDEWAGRIGFEQGRFLVNAFFNQRSV